MGSRTPTLAEVIRSTVDTRLGALHVALPARVESYDASKPAVSVQPLLKESTVGEDGAELVESLPVVTDVPVMFPGAGGRQVRFEINPGDTGLLVFTDRSMDVWLSHGGEVDPLDARRHSLGDAVFIPGLHAFTDAASGPEIVITSTAVNLGGEPAVDSVLKGTAFQSALTTWTAALATCLGTIGAATVSPGSSASAVAALATATTSFLSAVTAALSATVKVK